MQVHFDEFPDISKAEWLRQIAKDLKDKPLDILDWPLGEGLTVSPLVHAEDQPVPPDPLSAAPNHWDICEDIVVTDHADAHRQCLDALEAGTESLTFHLDTPIASGAMAVLLHEVYLDFIGLHFAGAGVAEHPAGILAALSAVAADKHLDTRALRGSLAYAPAQSERFQPDWRYLADLSAFTATEFPLFQIIQVDGSAYFKGKEYVAAELAAHLRCANLYLEKLSERGVPLSQVVGQLQFSVTIGTSYFVEMAKLRALKLVWFNVLRAWGLPPTDPVIEVRFAPSAYTDDLYTNMIRGTSMAMSAVLGGTQRLTVRPYDAGREAEARYPQAFSRRIARNVQHLLKMETALHETSDPAAGSYYIESLTRQLAERAWAEM